MGQQNHRFQWTSLQIDKSILKRATSLEIGIGIGNKAVPSEEEQPSKTSRETIAAIIFPRIAAYCKNAINYRKCHKEWHLFGHSLLSTADDHFQTLLGDASTASQPLSSHAWQLSGFQSGWMRQIVDRLRWRRVSSSFALHLTPMIKKSIRVSCVSHWFDTRIYEGFHLSVAFQTD